jgi:hypothetical protein
MQGGGGLMLPLSAIIFIKKNSFLATELKSGEIKNRNICQTVNYVMEKA